MRAIKCCTAFLLLSVVIMGSGCRNPDKSEKNALAPVPSASSAVAAAERLRFVAGDSFEIRQTFFGLGVSLAEFFSSQEGIRLVNVERFEPRRNAELRWLSMVERETLTSKQARERYEAQLRSRKKGQPFPPPPPVETEKIQADGTVTNINLKDSHTLFLPAYWSAQGETNALTQKTAVWLADDAFNELSNSHKTVIYPDLFGEAASQWTKRSQDLKRLLDKARKKVTEEEAKKDIFLVEVEPEPIAWPLIINGKEAKVSAWRGKNSFGEFIILNNRQNPLVLKFAIQPLFAGVSIWTVGAQDWKKAFGYEVTNLLVQNFRG